MCSDDIDELQCELYSWQDELESLQSEKYPDMDEIKMVKERIAEIKRVIDES